MKAFIKGTNIISPLGFTTEENFENILKGESGIRLNVDPRLSDHPFPASTISDQDIEKQFAKLRVDKDYTRFEKIALLSVKSAIEESVIDASSDRTAFILSTTKGNVHLLDECNVAEVPLERTNLFVSAQAIADFFGIKNTPIVISNACISGVAAIVMGQRLIDSGKFDHVVVNGTDILSKFIVSGFQSFLSLSAEPCKPFDARRDGLTLGEASSTVVLSKDKAAIEVVRGATSNDANHISGPSRTAEGLLVAINNTLKGDLSVDAISLHGTATRYNDDMESIALSRAGLSEAPVNSLKGYFGHTLGAAGVIESVISIAALKSNKLIPTLGYKEPGTVEKINVIQAITDREIKSFLKLASGFGGCNSAVLFTKHD